MSEPSEKSPKMETFLEEAFGRTSAIRADICVFCKKPVTPFRNEVSKREYNISGLCQNCQDDTFGKD